LMADETPLPVQTKDNPGSTHKGYDWVYFAPEKRLVLFDYRKRGGVKDLLKYCKIFLVSCKPMVTILTRILENSQILHFWHAWPMPGDTMKKLKTTIRKGLK
ncbi:MAG: transposase, partial [Chloroflexi bacterium]|nr:transposase [Chloroflexota bacterium]